MIQCVITVILKEKITKVNLSQSIFSVLVESLLAQVAPLLYIPQH